MLRSSIVWRECRLFVCNDIVNFLHVYGYSQPPRKRAQDSGTIDTIKFFLASVVGTARAVVDGNENLYERLCKPITANASGRAARPMVYRIISLHLGFPCAPIIHFRIADTNNVRRELNFPFFERAHSMTTEAAGEPEHLSEYVLSRAWAKVVRIEPPNIIGCQYN